MASNFSSFSIFKLNSLRNMISKYGNFQYEQIVKILKGLASAVAYIHKMFDDSKYNIGLRSSITMVIST